MSPLANSRQSRRSFLSGAALLGAFVAVGCRPAPAAGLPPTLTILGQNHPVQAVQDLLTSQAAAAAREIGAAPAATWSPPETQRDQLARAMAAKQLPNVGLIGGPDSAPLVAHGALRDLRESLDRIAGVNGDLFPPLKDLATAGPFADRPANVPAPVWAIPHLSLGCAWLVRSDLYATTGQAAPSNFADALGFAQAVTNPSTERFGWGGALPVSDAGDNFAQICLLDEGAALFDGAGERIALNPADAVPGLDSLVGLYRAPDGTPLAPPGVVDWSIDEVAAALAQGRIAQTIDFGGLYPRILAGNPSLATTLQALPFPGGSQGWYTAATTSTLVVFDKSSGADLAVQFVERLLDPNRFAQVVRAGMGSVVPPYAYLMRSAFWDQDPNYKAYAVGARGDPARGILFATLGQPAPLTLPVAVVRGGRLLAAAARAAIGGTQSLAAATALRDQARALTSEGYALQPAPTATPVPGWLRDLEAIQRVMK